jgi:hypothetical protein
MEGMHENRRVLALPLMAALAHHVMAGAGQSKTRVKKWHMVRVRQNRAERSVNNGTLSIFPPSDSKTFRLYETHSSVT